jgi:hypothetical protein
MSSLSGTTRHHEIRYQIHFGTQGSLDPVLNPFRCQVVRYSGTTFFASILVLPALFRYQTRDCVQSGTRTSISRMHPLDQNDGEDFEKTVE